MIYHSIQYTHVTQTSESQALLDWFDIGRFVHVQPPPWQRLSTSQTFVVTNFNRLNRTKRAWNRMKSKNRETIKLHQTSKLSNEDNSGIIAWLRYVLCYVPNAARQQHAPRAPTKHSYFWAWVSSRDSARINAETNSRCNGRNQHMNVRCRFHLEKLATKQRK